MSILKRVRYSLVTLFLIYSSNLSAAYMEVTLLGTGTPRPSIERFGPATVVEANGRFFIFDSGRGITVRLQQAGIALSKIEHVFLTHLHSDHISGLSDLWLTSWIWQRSNKLKLTGPIGTQALAKHLTLAHQADLHYRAEHTKLNKTVFEISSHDIASEGIVYNHNGVKITAFLVNHYPVEPAYGYRIDSGEQSIVISGDTTYSKNLIQFSKNVDLLIHEIAAADANLLASNPRLKKVMSYHTTPEQAGKVLKATKPKATVFTHVLLFGVDAKTALESTRTYFNGDVRIGHDLMKISVGETITFD